MIPATAVPCSSATRIARVDEIAREHDAAVEVRMIELDARIDRGHANVPARRDTVQLVQVPEPRRGLQRIERVVVRQDAEVIHRLHGLDPGVERQALDQGLERKSFRSLHDEAIDTERRHRPASDDPQLEAGRKRLGNPLPVGAAGLGRVAADIAGVGTKVERRQAKHHQ